MSPYFEGENCNSRIHIGAAFIDEDEHNTFIRVPTSEEVEQLEQLMREESNHARNGTITVTVGEEEPETALVLGSGMKHESSPCISIPVGENSDDIILIPFFHASFFLQSR